LKEQNGVFTKLSFKTSVLKSVALFITIHYFLILHFQQSLDKAIIALYFKALVRQK